MLQTFFDDDTNQNERVKRIRMGQRISSATDDENVVVQQQQQNSNGTIQYLL
jgi:hypothetical protein